MSDFQLAANGVCARVAEAIRKTLPPGFRGKLTVNILDSGGPLAHDVVIEYRPSQPKAGMGKS